jgi:hypothetical protein
MLPAATDTVETMLGKSCAEELRKIPLADNTVRKTVSDISENLHDQLINELQNLGLSSI